MTAGFTLHLDALESDLPSQWTVISVAHNLTRSTNEPYVAQFSAVPASVPYRPHSIARQRVFGLDYATVVGPEGTRIHTDEQGRVKVRFHWDRRSPHPRHATCWIRILHQSTGARFGSQHIPRVGSEVAVAFLGGDPDRPVVLGELRNALSPNPFELPHQRTRSGWRTQSLAETGYHELSFDDRAGGEEVHLRAQGRLRELVLGEHVTEVMANRNASIHGDQTLRVRGATRIDTLGPVSLETQGGLDFLARQSFAGTVEGNLELMVQGASRLTFGDRASMLFNEDFEIETGQDATLRTFGSLSILAGHDRRPSSASMHAEGWVDLRGERGAFIQSADEIRLAVGNSSLSIRSGEIVLSSPQLRLSCEQLSATASEQALLQSEQRVVAMAESLHLESMSGSRIALNSEVYIEGTQVLLNSPTEAAEPPTSPSESATIVHVVDEEGKPMAGYPFVLRSFDGAIRTAILGTDGAARIWLSTSCQISFPMLTPGASAATASDPHRAHTATEGDDLLSLGLLYGTAPDGILQSELNQPLRDAEADPMLLITGKELWIRTVDPVWEPLNIGATNEFVVERWGGPTEILLEAGDGPLANHPCLVRGFGSPRTEHTDASGRLTIVDDLANVVTVEPEGRTPLAFHLGHLEPPTTIHGLQSRLQALGFLHQSPSGSFDAATLAAMLEFGEEALDFASLAFNLEEAHGR